MLTDPVQSQQPDAKGMSVVPGEELGGATLAALGATASIVLAAEQTLSLVLLLPFFFFFLVKVKILFHFFWLQKHIVMPFIAVRWSKANFWKAGDTCIWKSYHAVMLLDGKKQVINLHTRVTVLHLHVYVQ